MQPTRRQAQERRGLRILLWIPCLFVLTQTLGGLMLDYVWVRPRYPTKTDMYAQLKARRQPPEILFVGSSRFQGDINCPVLDAELRLHLGHRLLGDPQRVTDSGELIGCLHQPGRAEEQGPADRDQRIGVAHDYAVGELLPDVHARALPR